MITQFFVFDKDERQKIRSIRIYSSLPCFVSMNFAVEKGETARYNRMKNNLRGVRLMDNRECMVSVLCLAYNHEKYIAQTLESLVAQKTDFRFEVLVNDDASTDGTADILRDYAARYPDIIVPFCQEKNLYSQGFVMYEKVFFPVAKGKYFASIEGDDYWCDPNKLQTQVNFLESHPEYAACVHNSVMHFMDGSEPDRLFISDRSGDRALEFEPVMRGMSNAYHTSSLLARREAMIGMPPFYYTALRYGFGDHPRAIWFLLNGGVWFIDKPMSVYRVRSNPQSWSSNLDRQYRELKRFTLGQIAMIDDLMPLLNAEQQEIAKTVRERNEFELLFIEGRARDQFRKPYRKYLKQQSFGYKAKWLIKAVFPRLHSLYRKKQGYGDY